MKKNVYTLLKNLTGSIIGVYIGYCLATYIDYRRHSQLYAMQSASWYIELFPIGILTIFLCLILSGIRYLIKKKSNSISDL